MDRILIVEDDESIRETLKNILELSGYEVSAVENGRLGLEAIITNPPDLVVCDVDMPELNGFELLGAINQRLKDEIAPPFIFLTALGANKDIRNGMNLGADDYILKPFQSIEVIEAIQLRLEKRKKLFLKQANQPQTRERIETQTSGKIALPCHDGLELVAFNNIVRCQADRAYCTFFLKDGRKLLISKAMKEYEATLLAQNFFKVHKSNIVNMSFAEKYVRGKGGYLVLSDGSQVLVSARRKEELVNMLTNKN